MFGSLGQKCVGTRVVEIVIEIGVVSGETWTSSCNFAGQITTVGYYHSHRTDVQQYISNSELVELRSEIASNLNKNRTSKYFNITKAERQPLDRLSRYKYKKNFVVLLADKVVALWCFDKCEYKDK